MSTPFQNKSKVSSAIWVPLIWYAICATRPIGVWLDNTGLSLSNSGSNDLSGSPVDRAVYSILILIGIFVLFKRKNKWQLLWRGNAWLVIFIMYLMISISWSDYQIVSIKRAIKIIGSIIMVMIVLTESEPFESFTTLLRRCFFVYLPLSIILIKYFRPIGVGWDYMGDAEMWLGLATSKNILGQVVMVSGIIFLLHMLKNRGNKVFYLDLMYLSMSLFLLKGSEDAISATSLAVFMLGVFIIFIIKKIQHSIKLIRKFVILSIILILIPIFMTIKNSLHKPIGESLFGILFSTLGRDITFTGRTEFWAEILEVASNNPIFGIGYGAFWIGRIVNVPFSERMTTWYLGQAHSGYIDLYLQLGIIGVFLFILAIYTGYKNILETCKNDFEFARLKMALLTMILLLNVTETTIIRGDHHMWFIFLFTVVGPHKREAGITL